MKTQFITQWALLLIALFPLQTRSQGNNTSFQFSVDDVPFVDNLCYQVDVVEKIKVVKGIETSTLTEHDKLKFITRNSTKIYNTYFSETSKPVFDVYYKKYNDGFNTWYQMPDLVRTDEYATYSYYSKESDLYPGGWFGNIATSNYGTFSNRNGERYYRQSHDFGSNGVYEIITNFYKKTGFLSKLSYTVPTVAELQKFEDAGFEVIVNVSFIKIRNTWVTLTWNLSEHIIIEEKFRNGIVEKVTNQIYTYNDQYQSYLLSKLKTVIPQQFENGECFEELIEETYSDYGQACDNSEVAFRSKNETLGLGIKLSPNPAIDYIDIDLNTKNNEIHNIDVFGVNGETMYSNSNSKGQRFIKIDINQWPSGVYIVKISTNKLSESIKFVKQ